MQGALATAIVEFDEEKVLSSKTCGSCPSCHLNQMVEVWFVVVPESGDANAISIGEKGDGFWLNGWVALESVLNGA